MGMCYRCKVYTHADEESIRRVGQIFRDAIKQKQA